MNPEIKDQWVQALSSGDYTQGYGLLRIEKEDGTVQHCALGVLCELAKLNGLDLPDPVGSSDHPYGDPGTRNFVPTSVREWAQLGDTAEAAVVNINDGSQFIESPPSYSRVVKYIEENL